MVALTSSTSPLFSHRRETLVVVDDRHRRHLLAPPLHEGLHARQILRRSAIGLSRLTDDNLLHVFLRDIFLQEIHEIFRLYRSQPIGNNLQRVSNGKPRSALAVVDGKNSSQCI